MFKKGHNRIKVNFCFHFKEVSGLSSTTEGKPLILEWKRGHRHGNHGELHGSEVSNKSSVLDKELQFVATMESDKSHKILSKQMTLSLKTTGKKTHRVGSIKVELSEYSSKEGFDDEVTFTFKSSKSKSTPELKAHLKTSWEKFNNMKIVDGAEQAEKVTIDGVDFNVQQADITELASTMGELSDEELEHIEQEWKEASSETENHEKLSTPVEKKSRRKTPRESSSSSRLNSKVVKQLQTALATAEAKVKGHQEEEKKHEAEISKLQAELKEYKEKLSKKEADQAVAGKQTNEKPDENHEKITQELEDLKKKYEEVEAHNKELEEKLAARETQGSAESVHELEERVKQLEEENGKLKQLPQGTEGESDLEDKVRSLSKQLEESIENEKSVSKELAQVQEASLEEVTKLQERISALESGDLEAEALKANVDKLQSKNSRLTKKMKLLVTEAEEAAKTAASSATKQLSRLESKSKKATQKAQSLQKQLDAKEKELAEIRKKHQQQHEQEDEERRKLQQQQQQQQLQQQKVIDKDPSLWPFAASGLLTLYFLLFRDMHY